MGAAKYCIDNKKRRSVRALIDSIYRWKKGSAEDGSLLNEEPIYQTGGDQASIHQSPGGAFGNQVVGQYAMDNRAMEKLAAADSPTDAEQSPLQNTGVNSVYAEKQYGR